MSRLEPQSILQVEIYNEEHRHENGKPSRTRSRTSDTTDQGTLPMMRYGTSV